MYCEYMEKNVVKYTKSCRICQKYTLSKKQDGKLPPQNTTMILQKIVCEDIVEVYYVTDGTGKDHTLMAMTFIDPTAGWFEISKLHT